VARRDSALRLLALVEAELARELELLLRDAVAGELVVARLQG
jgi:hypothetical protein